MGKNTFPLNIFMLFHVEFHVGFLSVDIRHLHHMILRCAANELRTYRTLPERHSDVIICPKKDPSPLLYLSSKKAFTRSYFLYTNALR